MALFKELSQAFSLVEVEPYGRVLVVPSKAFRQEWLPRLERENVKVYSGAHDGQACFFLKAEEPSKPLSLENASRLSAWSSEETEALLKLRSEGLTFEEIAKRIGKSEGACYSKWKRLTQRQQPKPKLVAERQQPTVKADAVQELIEALNMLYPKHKRVCLFLLKHASEVIGL